MEPVYEVPPPSYFAEDILKILLNPKILKSKVCTRTPLYVNGSSTYVTDVTALRHPDDIKKDSFGVWTYNEHTLLTFIRKLMTMVSKWSGVTLKQWKIMFIGYIVYAVFVLPTMTVDDLLL